MPSLRWPVVWSLCALVGCDAAFLLTLLQAGSNTTVRSIHQFIKSLN